MKDADALWLMRELMLETVAAGAAEGVKLTLETADEQLAAMRKLSSLNEVRPSTLQDVERVGAAVAIDPHEKDPDVAGNGDDGSPFVAEVVPRGKALSRAHELAALYLKVP